MASGVKSLDRRGQYWLYEKAMAEKKPVEIECHKCKTRFRLWVPAALFLEWKSGEEIVCVKCGARIELEKAGDNFRAASRQPVEEAAPEISPAEAVEAGAAAGETVLVVDDDGLVRKMAENVLLKNGLNPILSQNGQEALEVVEKQGVAVVVVDLHLKNPKDPKSTMDGEEFLQRLADSGKKLPAIVTTGKDLIDDIILEPKWYDLHVMAFIQKGSPFWTDDLIVKIKEILAKD